jgi:UDP-N-acetylmuramate-alanine ligase
LSSFVNRVAHAGDTVFFLGAGDIGELCHELAQRLSTAAGAAR